MQMKIQFHLSKAQIKSILNLIYHFQLFVKKLTTFSKYCKNYLEFWMEFAPARNILKFKQVKQKLVVIIFILIQTFIKTRRLRKMRPQKKYLSKLQKISETSSPSKQQQSPNEAVSIKSRINPANLTSSYLKFKTFEEQKSKRTFYLEESMKAQCQTNFCQSKNDLQSNRKTQTIEDKNQKISNLQEMVVRKKMELTLLQDCYEKRGDSAKKDKFDSVFASLLANTLKLCQKNKQGRKAYLSMVFRYGKERKNNPQKAFKFLMEWVLKIVKQIFSVMGKLLKIPTSNNE